MKKFVLQKGLKGLSALLEVQIRLLKILAFSFKALENFINDNIRSLSLVATGILLTALNCSIPYLGVFFIFTGFVNMVIKHYTIRAY